MPPSWENETGLSTTAPPGEAGAALAFDGASGAGYDVLFGGETLSGFLNGTWAYQNGSWSNISRSACRSVCPPPLAYASMAYDPAIGALVLVGGLTSCLGNNCTEGYSSTIYWFQNGSWSVGLGFDPVPADSASLAWYSPGNCLLLFGGDTLSGPSGSTNCYNGTTGGWAGYSGGPSPRWGAGMANSSAGYDVLFGGTSLFGALNDTWIFANGSWRLVDLGPSGAPPARYSSVLAESPAATVPGTAASGDVVLFGGEGPDAILNDTWTFRVSTSVGPGGQAFGNWTEDPSQPTPPPRYGASATLDFNASRVVLIGGASPGAPGGLSGTWAYFHLAASISESTGELNAESEVNFTVLAGGGSPPYSYSYSGLPPGCVGSDIDAITCVPDQHGHFTVGVLVTDAKGRTAASSVALTVDPYGSTIELKTEFAGMFYTGFSFDDTFGVETTIDGTAPAFVNGTIGNEPVQFARTSGTLWNATIDMGAVAPGAVLTVQANYTNWSLYGSLPVSIVESPPWMISIYDFPGAVISPLVNSTPREWNESYSEAIAMGWSLGTLLNFAIPTPGFSGAYSLVPGLTATFTFTSWGNVTMAGTISSDPSITIGPVEISAKIPGVDFSATVKVSGSFSVVPIGAGGPPRAYGVDWNSLSAGLELDAEFETEVPLFPASSPEGDIGLSLLLKIAPSVSVTVFLDPATVPGNFLGGLDMMVQNLVVGLGVAFTVALQAGISDVFEIGGGGTLSLQTLFQTATPHLAGLWLNASVFAFVQLLCFKITWTLWSGTLYQYGGGDPAAPLALPAPTLTWTWALAPRYYNTSAYDRLVWNGSGPGLAVEDVYPATSVSMTGAGDQALIAYTSDDVSVPEREGIDLDGLELGSSGTLAAAPMPSPAGDVAFDPELLTLPNGPVREVFSAVPDAALAGADPSSISGYSVETSVRGPSGGAWSSPVPIQSWGYPISYALDACGADGALAVLDAPEFGPNATTPERLVIYDPTTGAIEANGSVRGMALVTGYDCTDGIASLTDVAGNISLDKVLAGPLVSINSAVPSSWNLTALAWVAGAPRELALLYRSAGAAEAVVYALPTGTPVASTPVSPNASTVEAIAYGSGTYVFVGIPGGVQPYYLSASNTTELGKVAVPGLTHFDVALAGAWIVVLGLGATGNSTEPIDNLTIARIAVPPLPAAPVRSPPPSLAAEIADNAVAIVLGALLAALLLAVLPLYRTNRPRPTEPAVGGAAPPGPPGTTRPPEAPDPNATGAPPTPPPPGTP